MQTSSSSRGAVLGALTSLPVVAVGYLGQRLAALPSPPFTFFDWLTRYLPGSVVTFGIDLLVRLIRGLGLSSTGDVAKTVERAFAILLFAALGALFGAMLSRAGRKQPLLLPAYGALVGFAVAVILALMQRSIGSSDAGVLSDWIWLTSVNIGWGYSLGWLERASDLAFDDGSSSPLARRQFLYLVGGGILTVTAAPLALSRWFDRESPEPTNISASKLDPGQTSGPAQSPPQGTLDVRIDPALGTRPELTATEDFYTVDINALPRRIDGDSWRLSVEGLVLTPLSLSLAQIRARPAIRQVATLSCISNPVGGDLIGTAVWSGIRLGDILAKSGLQSSAKEIRVESADGFFESLSLDDAFDERTLLVYEMNDEPLTQEHGYPLRISIPDRYGMKQPKWITRLEVIDHEGSGFWVDRGWSQEAFVKQTSVVDNADLATVKAGADTLPIGGIAYAGARGISSVEVQIDANPWSEAQLRTPPLSPLTWVQWRYDWPFEPGEHTISVRAYDGSGTLQETRSGGARPDGATGIHTFKVRI